MQAIGARKYGVLLALVLVLTPGPTAGSASEDDQAGRISVDYPRPLMKVIEVLEKRFGWVITYEDPPYLYVADVEDVTLAVRKDFDVTKPVIGPRGGPFHFEYILPSGPPDVQAAAVLEALLDEYHRSGHAGVFEIIRTGSVFHVVPAMSRNALGELERYGSILDARISFPRQERSVGQMVDAIENAVSEATGSIVVGGLVPLRLFVETRVRDGADNEPARMVLLRTLNATRRKLSWRLLCGPGGPGAGSLPTTRLPETRRCALNVHHVGEAEAQPGSMA